MTDAKLAANRANALLSTGPATPVGKARSSLNAFRHGLTGQICMFTPEEGQAFEKHCTAIREALAPAGPIESYLAQAIAEDTWRLQRARALENSIFAQGYRDHIGGMDAGHNQVDAALAQAQTWKEQSHQLHLLTVYEQRINRTIEKNSAQLKVLQTERKTAYRQAQEEATFLAQLAQTKSEIYQPAADFTPASDWGGFVYARAEIVRVQDRLIRLSEANSVATPISPRLDALPEFPVTPSRRPDEVRAA
jgi:hypothetical protein